MHQFADRVGWKMQKRDEELVMEFCNEIGVERGILKVWMHNNKNTFAKKDVNGNGCGTTGTNGLEQVHNNGGSNNNEDGHNDNNNDNHNIENPNPYQDDEDGGAHVATNGSSSSS